jgi:hypothetical protein
MEKEVKQMFKRKTKEEKRDERIAKSTARGVARYAREDARKEQKAQFSAENPGLILMVNGLGQSWIKLFQDRVELRQESNDYTILLQDLHNVKYQKHITPLWMTFCYIVSGESKETSILGSPLARIHFDAMDKRLKQMIAGGTTQPQQPQSSPLDELAKLATLRDQGVVTEQEFQEQKAKLLGTQTVNQPRFDPQTGQRL